MTGPGECGCVPGHRSMILTHRCADCGLPDSFMLEGLPIPSCPGPAGGWPRDVVVAFRLTPGIRNAPEGFEEGALCVRGRRPGLAGFCLTRLVVAPDSDSGGCSCHRGGAPCGHCVSYAPECPRGCWRDESRP